jgi:hypothetical protein
MKLIYCPECHDTFRIIDAVRWCYCGSSFGRTLPNGHSEYWGRAVPVELDSETLHTFALQSNETSRQAVNAYVVPRQTGDFRKVTNQLVIGSPLLHHSNEPRCVVEGIGEEMLVHALELLPLALFEFWEGPGTFRYVAPFDDHLVICHPKMVGSEIRCGIPWTSLPKPLNVREMAQWIEKWLKTASYSTPPHFEGCEARGFVAFCVDFHGQPRQLYGHMAVMPKWMELHK